MISLLCRLSWSFKNRAWEGPFEPQVSSTSWKVVFSRHFCWYICTWRPPDSHVVAPCGRRWLPQSAGLWYFLRRFYIYALLFIIAYACVLFFILFVQYYYCFVWVLVLFFVSFLNCLHKRVLAHSIFAFIFMFYRSLLHMCALFCFYLSNIIIVLFGFNFSFFSSSLISKFLLIVYEEGAGLLYFIFMLCHFL